MLYNLHVTLNLLGTIAEEVADGPEYEISNFCVP